MIDRNRQHSTAIDGIRAIAIGGIRLLSMAFALNARADLDLSALQFATSASSAGRRIELREEGTVGHALVSGTEWKGAPDGASGAAWDTSTLATGWQTLTPGGAGGSPAAILKLDPQSTAIEGGRLQSNATWTSAKTHVVRHWVVVPNGVTLTISQGAIVKFCESAGIKVLSGGKVQVNGAEGADVFFASIGNDTYGGDTNLRGGDFATNAYEIVTLNGGTWSDNGYWVTPDAALRPYPTVALHDAIGAVEGGVVRIPVSVTGTRNAPFSIDWQISGSPFSTTSGTLSWSESGEGTKYIEIPLRTGYSPDGTATFALSATRARSVKLANEAARVLVYSGRIAIGDVIENGESPMSAATEIETRGIGGTMIAKAVEKIAYSPRWSGAAECSIALDGNRLLSNAAGAGAFTWSRPSAPGLYTFTHTAGRATLTARLAVLGEDSIAIDGTRMQSDATWTSDKVWIVRGTVTVASGATLTIQPGAVVKFAPGATLAVESGATCVARGAIFTHLYDDTAGGDTLGDGDATAPKMDDYAVTGTVTDDDSTEWRYTAPVVLSGTISQDTRWRGWKVYRVTGNLAVASGKTLTVEPGAIVKFNAGVSLTVNSGATLDARGTRAQPIVFTSVKDDEHGGDTNGDGGKTYPYAGDWHQLKIQGTATFDHCAILYNSASANYGGLEAYGGTVTIDNSQVGHCLYECVNAHSSGRLTARNTAFFDASLGFGYYGGSNVQAINCVFYGLTTAIRQSGKRLVNCVFSDCVAFTDQGGDGSTYDHCVFYNPSGFGAQSYSKVGTSGNLWGDPCFRDADAGDFRTKRGSACIDAGLASTAPELDFYGQPRDGAPDIGLYEAVGDGVVGLCDLAPASVTPAATSLQAGETLRVAWTLANLGATPVSGSWRDRVSLVDATGARSVDLGTVVSSGSLAPGASGAYGGAFRVPAEAEGTWFVAVHANAERDLFEGVLGTNNVLVSATAVTVAIPASEPSSGVSGVASADAPGFAKVAAGGEALLVRVSAPAGTVVYLGADYLPSAGGYTARAVAGADGTALLAVPAGTDAAYLVVESASGAPVAWSASFESGSLAVSRVSVPTLPYAGTATLGVTGAAFADGCAAALVRGGAVAVGAVAKTAVLSTTTLSLTLDCSKLAQGATYDLRVTAADGTTATLANAVTVATVPPKAQLKASLDVPATVRRGRTVTVWIDYENVGNAEMPAPVFEIVSQGQVFQVGDAISTNAVKVMGLSAEAPVGALRPGEPQRLGVKVTLLSQNIQWTLKSHHALQEGAGKPAFSLRELYDDDWVLSHPATRDPTVAAIRAAVGSTRADFYENLAAWLSENEPATIDYETAKFGFARYQYQKASGLLRAPEAAAANSASVTASPASTRSACQHGEQHTPGSGRCTRGIAGSVWKWCPNNGGHWFLLFRSNDFGTGVYSHEPMFGDGWSDTFDPNLTTYLVCHGNANSIDEDWVEDMARALSAKGACNVLAVNWGQIAFKGLPHVTAAYIPDVVDRAIEQLALLGINAGQTTVIGHSHGAHVGANIITRSGSSLASFKRFVGLDASTTDNKVHDWNAYAPTTWIGLIRERTQIAEFYKSSFDMSLEESNQLYGDYNFLVFREHDLFEYWTGGAAAFEGDAETERHGQSHQWFIRTIQNGSRYANLGFNFTGDSSWKVLSGDKVAKPGQSNFAGIIRDDCVEMLSPLRAESGAANWNYDGTVLSRDRWGDAKAARWFRKNLTRTIDYRVSMGALPTMDVGGSAVAFAASGSAVEFNVRNNADNLTVNYDDPNEGPATDRTAAPWRNNLAHGIWLIDYESLSASAKAAADAAIASNDGVVGQDVLKNLVANKANVRLVGDSDVIAPTLSLEPSSWFEGGDTRFTYPQSNDTVRVKVNFKNAIFGEDRPLIAETDENGEPTRYRECLLLVGAGMNAKKAETVPECYGWDVNADDNFVVRKIAAVPKEFRSVISVMESSPKATKSSAMRSVARAASPGSTALADGEVVPVEADENGNWSISLDGYASVSTDSGLAIYSFEMPDAASKPGTAVLNGKYTRYDMPWTTVSGTLPSTTDADGNLEFEGVRYVVKLTVMTEDDDDTATCILDVRRSAEDDPGEEEDTDGSREVQSSDPNEMAGPEGEGKDRMLKPGDWATYTIYFENKSDAEAAAASVSVVEELSEQLDWNTFEMLEVGFGQDVDIGLAGKASGTSEASVSGTNLLVRTQVALDTETGSASWYLRIVDPDGDEDGWPLDVYGGFLPPNDPETHCGEGHITYRVKVREDATPGARIDAAATIVFDYNDPIETDPAWWNTVGAVAEAMPVYRFYSKAYKGHFFTVSEAEKDDLVAHNPNWKFEGTAYLAYTNQVDGTVPLYRFYSKGYRGHFFTIDEAEMRTVRDTNPNWKYEGIAYYVYPQEVEGSVPVFRFWSKGYRHHFYTTDSAEKDSLIATNPNWKYETVAFWAVPAESRRRALAAPAGGAANAVGGGEGDDGVPFGDADPTRDLCDAEENDGGEAPGDRCGCARAAGAEAAEAHAPVPWTLVARPDAGQAAHGALPTAPLAALLEDVGEGPEGRVLAVPGVTDIGNALIETRLEAPDAREFGGDPDGMEQVAGPTSQGGAPEPFESENPGAFDPANLALRLALPEGAWSAMLWNAAEGEGAEEEAGEVFEFRLPASGAWHWLRVRDAADGEGDAFSIWLRAE